MLCFSFNNYKTKFLERRNLHFDETFDFPILGKITTFDISVLYKNILSLNYTFILPIFALF